MCIETHQTNANCGCETLHNFYCMAHVDHTHKQTDNKVCPNQVMRFVELKEGPCRSTRREPCHGRITYAFEHWTDARHCRLDWEFSEKRIESAGPHACEKDGRFRLSAHHTCGIGRDIKGEWRHVKPDYRVRSTDGATQAPTIASTQTLGDANTPTLGDAGTQTLGGFHERIPRAPTQVFGGRGAQDPRATLRAFGGGVSRASPPGTRAFGSAPQGSPPGIRALGGVPAQVSRAAGQAEMNVQNPVKKENVNPQAPKVKTEANIKKKSDDVDMEDSLDSLSLDDAAVTGAAQGSDGTQKPVTKKIKLEKP